MKHLRSMAEALAVLKLSPQLAARVAALSAPALAGLARASFAAQQNVYGDSFGTGAKGQPITLHKSGRLEAQAIRYEAVGTKIRSSVASLRYARYQIKRGFLPRGGGSLPTAWHHTIKRIAGEETAKAIGGSR